MPNVFLTGVTGYIGGTVFNTLATEHHPEFNYTVLVRSESKAAEIKKKYSNARTVIGDLDSLELIEEESAQADIVVNTANVDHETSPPAILRGLSRGGGKSATPRYLIHTSGTGILLDDTKGTTTATPQIYRDGKPENVEHLVRGLPDSRWHRGADKQVLFVAPRAANVHVAIICPPTIWGRGTGPGKIVSAQVPQLIKHSVARKRAFTVNAGDTVWGNVHVLDLTDIYVRLFDKALAHEHVTGGQPLWDTEGGYYLSNSGEHHWGDTTRLLAKILHEQGLVKDDKVDQLSPEDVVKVSETGVGEWGANSRGIATRARELLGWNPQRGNHEVVKAEWTQGLPVGLGKSELEDEVSFYKEGLVV